MRISDWSSDGFSSDLRGLALELNEVLQPHLLEQFQIGLQPVDVLLLGLQDVREEFARYVVADRLAVSDRLAQQWGRFHLELEVAFHALLHVFADQRSEQHTSELQSLMRISYADFCLKKHMNSITK